MRIHTLTNVMTWLLAAFMLFLAARGFLAAESAAVGFGFPLADPADAFDLHVKADRDLSIGIVFVALLMSRQRRALMTVLAASLVMPLVDCALVLQSGRATVLYALSVHGSAFVYCAALLALMLRENANEGVRTAPREKTREALAARS
jgi:Domain of unknown function (DUF4267)